LLSGRFPVLPVHVHGVRHHGDIARIEIPENERNRFFDEGLMDRVYASFHEIGFKYTALDLKGYRTGSMNEVLNTNGVARGETHGH
jgi:PP-loop superfamily ATP-utilizing enzyme